MTPEPRPPSDTVSALPEPTIPLDHKVFRCSGLRFDAASGEVALHYRLTGGSGAPIAFTERVLFPAPPHEPSQPRRAAFQAVLRVLHAVAGVSYFKTAAPPTIDLGATSFTAAELAYLRGVYLHGMREFAYQIDLPSVLRTRFVSDGGEPVANSDAPAGSAAS